MKTLFTILVCLTYFFCFGEDIIYQKAGKGISKNIFRYKYGEEKVDDLRSIRKVYFEEKDKSINEETSSHLRVGFVEDSLINYSILDLLKERFQENLERDTLRIKYELSIGVNKTLFYTILLKKESEVSIKTYEDKLDFEYTDDGSIVDFVELDLVAECWVSFDDLVKQLEKEKENCRKKKYKKDDRWTFNLDSGKYKNKEISDVFDYHLYFFFTNMVCED